MASLSTFRRYKDFIIELLIIRSKMFRDFDLPEIMNTSGLYNPGHNAFIHDKMKKADDFSNAISSLSIAVDSCCNTDKALDLLLEGYDSLSEKYPVWRLDFS